MLQFLRVDPNMNNHDFSHDEMRNCERCKKDTVHHMYTGHTFSEGTMLTECTECGVRSFE